MAAPAAPATVAAAPKKSSSLLLLIIGGLFLLILLAGFTSYFLRGSLSISSAPVPKPGDNKPPDPNAPTKPDLVSLPAGTFQMGRSDGADQEGPVRSVNVGAFSIDRTEVTNAEYAQFVQETGHTAPRQLVNGKPASGQEQWPVTNVSLDDAKAFAEWRSKRDGVTYRLPTEEEWEYAARDGSQGSIFPWGNEWGDDKANVDSTSLKPVGTSPEDKTKAGLVDMMGNAYEWTTSKASYYPGSKGQVRPDNKDWIIVRGGAYLTDTSRKQISATFRDWIPSATKNAGLGFRLVRSQ